MANRYEEYKGHHINIDVYEVGKKNFRWSYQIDAGPIRECLDRPLQSEELMFREALDQARREVDRLHP